MSVLELLFFTRVILVLYHTLLKNKEEAAASSSGQEHVYIDFSFSERKKEYFVNMLPIINYDW